MTRPNLRGLDPRYSLVALLLWVAGCVGVAYAAALYDQKGPHRESRPTLAANDLEQRTASGWQATHPQDLLKLSSGSIDCGGQVLTNVGALPASAVGWVQSREFHLTSDQTTTSTTVVDIPGATATVTTSAGTKLVVNCSYSSSTTSLLGATTTFVLYVDGAADAGGGATFPGIAASSQVGGVSRELTGLTATAHVLKMSWYTSNGTAQLRPSTGREHLSCWIAEVRY